MMPGIELTETTFRRLQSRGVAFVDTPESVICRLLDQAEGENRVQVKAGHYQDSHLVVRKLDVDKTADLKHTKILNARFANRVASNWNDLIVVAHAEAFARLGSFDKVRKSSISPLALGERADSGFHFQEALGFSIQNIEASKAWIQTLHLAKRLNVAVDVTFLWRDKEGAAFPGETGNIAWPGQPRKE